MTKSKTEEKPTEDPEEDLEEEPVTEEESEEKYSEEYVDKLKAEKAELESELEKAKGIIAKFEKLERKRLTDELSELTSMSEEDMEDTTICELKNMISAAVSASEKQKKESGTNLNSPPSGDNEGGKTAVYDPFNDRE